VATWWCLQHVPYEGPGAVADVLSALGHRLHVVALHDGADVPGVDEVVGPDGEGGLVVLGGPMGALDDAEHPFLPAERDLLAACVAHDVPVLAICLGAQLLAGALGADVFRGPRGEVGAGTVTLTEDAADDVVFATFADGDRVLPVVHWHHDTYDLPAGAVLLASSKRYEQQAFRAGARAYGLQFHVELGPRDLPTLQAHMNPARVPTRDELADVERAGRPLLELLLRAPD
jgi:GMP synthase-like glutamine amidotransferase